MNSILRGAVLLGSLLAVIACERKESPPNDTSAIDNPAEKTEHPKVSDQDPMKLVMPDDVTPATMIAAAGHGMYFDHLGRPIDVDDQLVLEMERSMSEQLMEAARGKIEPKKLELLQEAQAFAASGELKPDQSALLQGAVTSHYLTVADKKLTEQFSWRHRLLMTRYTPRITASDGWATWFPDRYRLIVEILEKWVFYIPSTDYVKRCQDADVPIPPPWSQSNPNGWVYHGKLQQNLLEPGRDAHVWSWSHPHKKGACILLPRNPLAGILCQSETTGKACIWDNLDRTTGDVIPWRTSTLNVNHMQDGDMLTANCTGCHRGNNAFLISPDDPTWEKVLRDPGLSRVGANFSTNVASHIARYEMISNQPEWGNVNGSQCIGCHERPMVGFSNVPNDMPPLCANGSPNDPSSCYNY